MKTVVYFKTLSNCYRTEYKGTELMAEGIWYPYFLTIIVECVLHISCRLSWSSHVSNSLIMWTKLIPQTR